MLEKQSYHEPVSTCSVIYNSVLSSLEKLIVSFMVPAQDEKLRWFMRKVTLTVTIVPNGTSHKTVPKGSDLHFFPKLCHIWVFREKTLNGVNDTCAYPTHFHHFPKGIFLISVWLLSLFSPIWSGSYANYGRPVGCVRFLFCRLKPFSGVIKSERLIVSCCVCFLNDNCHG